MASDWRIADLERRVSRLEHREFRRSVNSELIFWHLWAVLTASGLVTIVLLARDL